MATTLTTENLFNGNGSNKDFVITFPYLKEADVKVEHPIGTVLSSGYTFLNATTIRITTAPASGTANVKIYRDTNVDTAKAIFATGSSIRATDLNNNAEQSLFAGQEKVYTNDLSDNIVTGAKLSDNLDIPDNNKIRFGDGNDLKVYHDSNNSIISNSGGELLIDSDTLSLRSTTSEIYLHAVKDGAVQLKHDNNTKLATTSAGVSVTGAIAVSSTVDGRDLAADGAKLDGIEAGSTGNQTNAEIRAAVEAASDSNVFTDADHSKLNAIEASATADQTNAEIRAAVEAASDSNVFTDADHSKLNAIEASAKDDQTSTEIKALLASDKLTAAHIANATITQVQMGTDSVSGDEISANAITTTELANNAVQTENIATDGVRTTNIQNDAVTYAKIQNVSATSKVLGRISSGAGDVEELSAANIKTIYESNAETNPLTDAEKAVIDGVTANTNELNKLDDCTTSTAELNLLTGKSVVTTIAANATDSQLPSAQAVNERIVTVMQDAGGFVPIANEVSFPNTNPDPNDDAGTIVSIADAGGVVVNGSGVSTTGRTLGGSTVTINGIDSSLNSSTIAAGKGMLVETTSTLNTYTYHRLVVDEAGVANAQSLVNDFNERYRVGSSNPTSSKDDGDLFFNTSSNKMLVYNASDSSWDDVQSVGNYFINTISSYSGTGGNSATFNGSAYRFVLSNAGTYAQQHLVSVNGVIQKPNSGTSQPSEGFAVNGSSILFSAAPASGSDYFIITIGASVNIGTPGSNTVTSAHIVDGSIVNADVSNSAAIAGSKLADDSITEVKLDIHAAPSGTNKFLGYTSNGMEWAVPPDTNTTVGGSTGVDFNDNVKIRSGTGNDLEIYHDSNNSIISNGTGELLIDGDTLSLRAASATELYVHAVKDGAVKLYYDNSKKFETGAQTQLMYGNLELTDGWSLYLDNGFNNATSRIVNAGGNGVAELKFYTQASGGSSTQALHIDGSQNATFAGDVDLADSKKLKLGTSDDLQIYHDGTNSYLTNTGGILHIKNNDVRIQSEDSETMIRGIGNGSVELYHNNIKRLETTSGGITVTGDITFTSNMFAGDSDKINLGAGNDLQIYHNGAHNIIQGVTSGQDLYIGVQNEGDEVGFLKSPDTEWLIRAIVGGASSLRYDGAEKLTTTAAGITVSGHIDLDDANFLKAGTGDDLWVGHDGNHSYINHNGTGALFVQSSGGFYVQKYGTTERLINANNDGNVELFYDSVKKLDTHSNGVSIYGNLSLTDADSRELRLGAGSDLKLYHSSNNNYIVANTTGQDIFFKTSVSSAADTSSMTIRSDGSITHPDNIKTKWGASDDLQLFHDGNNSVIDNNTGDLLIRMLGSSGDIYLDPKNGERGIKVIRDGAVELYYDNVKKFETHSVGCRITSSTNECNLLLTNDARTWKIVNYDYGSGNDHLGFHDGTADRLIIQNNGNIHLPADGQKLVFGTDDDLEIYHSGSDSVFRRPVSGAVNFYFEDNDATTNILMRIGKTQGATNNERHQMFSFGLPGVNRGLAQCGSSNSEAPIWAASSDYRIKENFRAYTGGWDAIKAIPVQLYDEKSPSYWTQGADKKDMKGWRAHEVQAVIPEAVTGAKDAVVTQALIDAGQYQESELNQIIPQQLGTTAMLPDVIGALQQAMAKIETLETKVAALEAE